MVPKRQPTSLLLTFFNLLEILGMEKALLWHWNVKGQFFHMSGKIIVKMGLEKKKRNGSKQHFLCKSRSASVIGIQKKNKWEARFVQSLNYFSEPKTNYAISYKPSSYWYFTVPVAPQTAFTSGMWAAPSQALPGEHSGFSSQRVSNCCEPNIFCQVTRQNVI